MNASEFTLEFFQKCLSQVKWDSTEERDILAREHLFQVAKERDWLYNFPVAETAKEQPKTQTPKPIHPMLQDIYNALVKPLVDAIDRNTAAQPGAATHATPCELPPAASTEPEPPKKAKKAKAPEPEPEPEPIKETPVEEPYMSGPELCDLMAPLKDTDYSKKLVVFRNDVVGFKEATRNMTDPDMLRQMEAKIREFLAALEKDKEEV